METQYHGGGPVSKNGGWSALSPWKVGQKGGQSSSVLVYKIMVTLMYLLDTAVVRMKSVNLQSTKHRIVPGTQQIFIIYLLNE